MDGKTVRNSHNAPESVCSTLKTTVALITFENRDDYFNYVNADAHAAYKKATANVVAGAYYVSVVCHIDAHGRLTDKMIYNIES